MSADVKSQSENLADHEAKMLKADAEWAGLVKIALKLYSNPDGSPNRDTYVWVEGAEYGKANPYKKDSSHSQDADELDNLLMDISTIFDGWHSTDDACWTDWDKSVRARIDDYRKKYTYQTNQK